MDDAARQEINDLTLLSDILAVVQGGGAEQRPLTAFQADSLSSVIDELDAMTESPSVSVISPAVVDGLLHIVVSEPRMQSVIDAVVRILSDDSVNWENEARSRLRRRLGDDASTVARKLVFDTGEEGRGGEE